MMPPATSSAKIKPAPMPIPIPTYSFLLEDDDDPFPELLMSAAGDGAEAGAPCGMKSIEDRGGRLTRGTRRVVKASLSVLALRSFAAANCAGVRLK
jgi:hypothetical protein